MDATTGTGRELTLRPEPDASRPAVSTAVAAARKQVSRYYISELVRQGKLDGYGVRRREGGRIRWYVYEDALPPAVEDTERVRLSFDTRELLGHLRDVRKYSLLARDERGSAHRRLLDVVDQLINAVQAAKDGEIGLAIDLLLEAQRARNDEERRLLIVEKHEAEVEKSLEAALWGLLRLGEESESGANDNTRFALPEAITAPDKLEFSRSD